MRLLLKIDKTRGDGCRMMADSGCHKGKIDTKASRKVYKRHRSSRLCSAFVMRPAPVGSHQASFIPRCLLTRALLHRNMRRIYDSIDTRPTGQFRFGLLPTGYLLQGIRHIHLRILFPLKCQLAHVRISMLADIFSRCLVHFVCKST